MRATRSRVDRREGVRIFDDYLESDGLEREVVSVPLRRPLVAALATALLASSLLSSGLSLLTLCALLLLAWPLFRRLVRARPGLGQGLSAGCLVLWFAVCLLHSGAHELPEQLFEGTWRVDATDHENMLGHFDEGGGRFELPLGVAREGERLRLSPSRSPSRRATAPDFVRKSRTLPPPQRVEVDEVERLAGAGRTPSAWLARTLRGLRGAGLTRVEQLESETTRGLASALLFGDKSLLPRGMADLFTRTGTRHALAVSGLHVALVAALWIWPLGSVLAWIFRKLLHVRGSFRWLAAEEFWRAALLALLVPLTGAGAPVIRAALALTLAQLAGAFHARPGASGELEGARRPDALSLWAFALLLEWLANPACLESISVVLSYGATLGLLLFAGPTLRWLRGRLPNDGRVKAVGKLGHRRPRLVVFVVQRTVDLTLTGLSASFAANLATLPVVWFVFGEWSWVGCFATLLLLPLLAAFLGIAWGWVLLPGLPLEPWLDGLARAQIVLLEVFDGLPGTPTSLPTRPAWALGLVLLLSFAALRRPRVARLALASWSLLILPWRGPPAELEVYALDVGSGTAVLVRPPTGPSWLFDAGSRDRPGVARNAVAPLLRELDIRRVVIALSHGEADHAGALPWLLERYPPEAWVGALPAHLGERLPHGTPRLDLAQGRLAVGLASAGETLEATLIRGLAIDGNEGSRDLELNWRGRRLLLCGDAEGRGRARMLHSGLMRGPCDLLLFPHHGSDTPWLGPLLAETDPAEVWISAGRPPGVAEELERRGLSWRSTYGSASLVRRFEPTSESSQALPGTNRAINGAPIRRP